MPTVSYSSNDQVQTTFDVEFEPSASTLSRFVSSRLHYSRQLSAARIDLGTIPVLARTHADLAHPAQLGELRPRSCWGF